jgi:hypothetical protein
MSAGELQKRISRRRLLIGSGAVLATAAAAPFFDPQPARAATLSPLASGRSLMLKGIAAGTIYATETSSLYGSSDGGNTWIRQAFNLPAGGHQVIHGWQGGLLVAGDQVDGSNVKHAVVWKKTSSGWRTVLRGSAGSSNNTRTNLTGDDTYLFFGEYGLPQGGPSIYRSADGVNWNRCYNNPKFKHIHAVAADPYQSGDVYATVGDGVGVALIRSRDQGNTWANVLSPGTWQSVQISFDADYVWLAGDNGWSSSPKTAAIFDRGKLTASAASPNYHYDLPVPGGGKWLNNAYFGAVDSSSGYYYCVTAPGSDKGTKHGMFLIPGAGKPVQVYAGPVSWCWARVYISHGKVWTDRWKAPLAA